MITSKNKKNIYFIIGPTASGKTALSIKLAKEIRNAEVVSADSRQVYTDFDLSSGKVTEEEKEDIPHHLLDVVNPGETFSVFEYTNLALQKIEEIYSRGNIPIICGGTGFYIDSLLYEYNLPNVPKNEHLRTELTNKTNNELFKILKKKLLNSVSKKIKYLLFGNKLLDKYRNAEFKNNPHRMIRAIEIVDFLGYLPELKKTKRFPDNLFDVHMIFTNVSREVLKGKIHSRILDRLNKGMIEEIVLTKKKYNLSNEYLESLGLEFKWITRFLQKQITKEEMIEKLSKDTYQYARRQETWFRRYAKATL